ncbi:MAG: trypsin-like peptidase domain-containing protein [Fimbriimonadaceae bacterium]|nr:trypsin-like peptidase domain-containing protein [Alphaproteobacteria bacterium]
MTAKIAVSLVCFLIAGPVRADQPGDAIASVVSLLLGGPRSANRVEEPEASGVVIFDGRHILTALHAVDRASPILVRTFDGRVMEARMAARDAASDLALLEIDEALPPATFAGDVVLGQKVCAIGNAFGLGLSMTCGIVSGVNRSGVGFNGIEDFVQTDTAVNPGASGGALVDEEGRLVGILSAIFTKTSDANIGVNFAVAAPLAERVAVALRDTGRVRWLTSGLRLKPNLEGYETGRPGARVIRVQNGSPAENATFKVDDLIIEAEGRKIRTPKDFVSTLARFTAPNDVTVRILRDGETRDLVLQFK